MPKKNEITESKPYTFRKPKDRPLCIHTQALKLFSSKLRQLPTASIKRNKSQHSNQQAKFSGATYQNGFYVATSAMSQNLAMSQNVCHIHYDNPVEIIPSYKISHQECEEKERKKAILEKRILEISKDNFCFTIVLLCPTKARLQYSVLSSLFHKIHLKITLETSTRKLFILFHS